jgi:predicted permease
VQVTLAVVLLFAVGLLGQSFLRLQQRALGFEPRGVLTVSVNFPWDTPSERLQDFRTRALEGLTALPGVKSAGVLDRLPLEGGSQSGPIAVQGRDLPPELAELEISHRAASPGALATLGVPLLAGRLPRENGARGSGTSGGTREALINRTLARAYFADGPGENAERGALGRRITFDVKPGEGETPTWFEVVGVVGDVRREVGESEPGPEVFVLPADTYWPLLRFVLRAEGDSRSLAGSARAALHAVAPDLYVDGVAPMEDQIDLAFASARTRLWLLASFALVALLLAAIGLYGVLASDVARRTREIGVRLALGAAASKVLSEQVGQGAKMAGVGLAVGLTVSLVGAQVLVRRLGELFVQPDLFDPGMLAGISVVLLLTAGLASFLPARRASLVEPAEALRHE